MGSDGRIAAYGGIDVGLDGGIAVVEGPRLVVAWRMPLRRRVMASGVRRRVLDLGELWEIAKYLREAGVEAVAIEDQSGRRRQGAATGVALGRQWGAIEGLLHAAGVAFVGVPPAQWKTALGANADKAKSREIASALWPAAADEYFAPGTVDGVAEAALIAEWARRSLYA